MSDLAVDIQRATDASDLPADSELEHWAAHAWQSDESSEVTLRIVDREESAQLNSLYRHKTGPTNVLSFPFEAPAGITVPLVGDLVVCAPVVEDEAREQGKTLRAHWAHMIIHGMLHLQGYDHLADDEAELMEALEIGLLKDLGFGNPYESEETEKDS